ncbi:MAG: ATP-binding cassette domain-containing protein [Chthoniobacterales bacterium]|nr:ATP-binding cassette domain-containing protein [Chthoniobacterales bacterium]
MDQQRIASDVIRITGARENNLQNLTLSLPARQLVALAGVSGAGKSTLAHHIIARLARRRLGRLRGEPHALAPSYEPAVDAVNGLPPCIELPQEPLRGQSRSTVASYTGLLDLLAGLFLHHGQSRSPGGEAVVPVNDLNLAEWFHRHHEGQTITLADARSDLAIGSAGRLPNGTFYYRERRTSWAAATRTSSKSKLPARWWIAEPRTRIKVASADDASRLVPPQLEGCLWVIANTFIEAGVHRLAPDDPAPYEPLGRRLFSFNVAGLGGGQCPACAGLGVTQGISEQALIRSAEAPLLDGGLNLAQNSAGRFTHLGVLDDVLRGLLRLRNVPTDISWVRLSPELRRIVMHGSGTEPIPELPRGEARLRSAKRPFAGIVPLILTRIRSTGPAAKIFQQWVAEMPCPDCGGSRFNKSARACQWRDYGLAELVSRRSLGELRGVFEPHQASARSGEGDLVRSIVTLITAYEHLNLGHLPLSRATSTLSGGEAQRLKLGLGLALRMRDACYILDEPSRGLHAQDIGGLAAILRSVVRDENTVILVEHQPLLLRHADHLITLGPGGGSAGGRVVYDGPAVDAPRERASEITGSSRRSAARRFLEVKRLSLHNIQNAEFRLPVSQLTAVVGVSGAGKSSAVLRALVPAARGMLEGAGESPICRLRMPPSIRFVEVVGQKLAGQNRRSVVATVLEILDPLRKHFAAQPDSEALGLDAGDFSFNSTGACPSCGGSGVAQDGFGAETDARCHVCDGTRLAGGALLVRSEGCGIAELLDIPVATLAEHPHPAFDAAGREKLAALIDLGLGHLALGRATPTLSAGERQRLALARFLARLERSEGAGLLVLDEPTAGLSVSDAARVFERIHNLTCEHGHTAIVLEHKLELLPLADWIVEFGPGGGPAGGQVIFEGTSVELAKAATPTATAWRNRTRKPVTTDQRRSPPTAESVAWERCADVFECLAARSEIRDEVDLVGPLRPAVRLNADRIPKDARIGELLDLLPWARAQCTATLPAQVSPLPNSDALAAAAEGHSFGFSPVAPQLRLGLATPGDLVTAVRALLKLGFREALTCQGHTPLRDLPAKIASAKDLTECVVVCGVGMPQVLRATALRWSQGVVRILDDEGSILATRFVSSTAIGLSLSAPFVGDWHSPQGRCAQCVGTGRLPAYPWGLIVADERKGIADDKFWNPAVLEGIRSLRRSRIIPESEFFAKQQVADFRQAPARMDTRTRLLFEHGIPWRHFHKPSARRIDREQDHYSWRGLHDYVYLSLGRIADLKHKQRLKDGFRELLCPACEGTGMGWEAGCLELQRRTFREIWRSMPLTEWQSKLTCPSLSLNAAVALGLGKLRANDRFFDVPTTDRDQLMVALAQTAPLTGLALISTAKHARARNLVERISMKLISLTPKGEE